MFVTIFKWSLFFIVEIWLSVTLFRSFGFTGWLFVNLATTALGAALLLYRYPEFVRAKAVAKPFGELVEKYKEDPSLRPPDFDSQHMMQYVVFALVYMLSVILIIIPSSLTDLIGIFIVAPYINRRLVKKYSRIDLSVMLPFLKSINFGEHPSTEVEIDLFFWMRLGLIVLVGVGFTWLWGLSGAIASIFLAIAIILLGNQLRQVYSSVNIHPHGFNGHNRSKNFLGKYDREGSQLHITMRGYWMQSWARFIYNKDITHWSWRFYAFIILFCVTFYISPLVGLSICCVIVSVLFKMGTDISIPTALYLGSSAPQSHKLRTDAQQRSGIHWVSLLDDTTVVDAPTDENGNVKVEDPMSAATLMFNTNVWSLRKNEAEDWITTVQDFIDAAAVIVVRPENHDAVQAELELLAETHNLQRVIILRSASFDGASLPAQLAPCLIDEEQAMQYIDLIKTNPRKFKEIIQQRFSQDDFSAYGFDLN